MTLEQTISALLQEPVLIGLLAASLRMATPLVFAALGQVFTQSAGVLDLSVEGLMMVGAFFGFVGAFYSGSLWIGVFIGMISAALCSLLMAFMSVTLRANQTIVSIMLGLILEGLVTFLNKWFFGSGYIPPKTAVFQPLTIPFLSDLPYVGQILFQQNLLVYLALLLVPIVSVVLYRTTFGLSLRAIGENPRAADAAGINVFKMQYVAILIGSLFAGLSGVFLTLGWTGLYTDNITAGRGWLAIALVFFGKWNPYRVTLGALIFGLVNAVQLRVQALSGDTVAHQLLLMIPYLLCILALIGASRRAGGPANLTVAYRRE